MGIQLDDLRMVQAVAQFRNISKAATHLRLTQPALSWSLKKLETELGVLLFHRTKKGVVPTSSGVAFLNRVRDLVSSWESLKENLQRDQTAIRGSFSLGIHGTLAAFTLPKFCPELLEKHPQIELKLTHDHSRNISRGVVDYRFDYGIVVNPGQHLDLVVKHLFNDRVMFWVANQPHQLQDPAHEDAIWLCNPNMKQAEEMMVGAGTHDGWKTRRIIYTSDLIVIASMVAAGGGIGLLPETLARAYPSGNLVPLVNTPSMADEICLTWRADTQKSAASKLVRQAIMTGLFEPKPSKGELREPKVDE